MRRSFAATLALAAAFVFAPPASAQQAEYGDAMGGVDQVEEDRGTVMRFLERPEVGGAAESMGVDVQDVGRAVLDMNGEDVSLVADRVREIEESAAADTITITTTALVIGLLILIIILLVD